MDKAVAKYRIIEEILNAEENLLNVSMLCSTAGVSRQGYYYWLRTKDARDEREERDKKDFGLILEAYNFRGYAKGARGIHMRLLHLETPVVMNHKKIKRLMRKYGLECPIRQANPYRRIPKSLATESTAENALNREFRKHGARKVLLTDITYIPFQGRFCYYIHNTGRIYKASTVLCSERIVGSGLRSGNSTDGNGQARVEFQYGDIDT